LWRGGVKKSSDGRWGERVGEQNSSWTVAGTEGQKKAAGSSQKGGGGEPKAS